MFKQLLTTFLAIFLLNNTMYPALITVKLYSPDRERITEIFVESFDMENRKDWAVVLRQNTEAFFRQYPHFGTGPFDWMQGVQLIESLFPIETTIEEEFKEQLVEFFIKYINDKATQLTEPATIESIENPQEYFYKNFAIPLLLLYTLLAQYDIELCKEAFIVQIANNIKAIDDTVTMSLIKTILRAIMILSTALVYVNTERLFEAFLGKKEYNDRVYRSFGAPPAFRNGTDLKAGRRIPHEEFQNKHPLKYKTTIIDYHKTIQDPRNIWIREVLDSDNPIESLFKSLNIMFDEQMAKKSGEEPQLSRTQISKTPIDRSRARTARKVLFAPAQPVPPDERPGSTERSIGPAESMSPERESSPATKRARTKEPEAALPSGTDLRRALFA